MDFLNYDYDTVEDCIINKPNLNINDVSLRIFQWNIRGMNSLTKFDVVKEFLDRYESRIDVIVVGETWVREGCTELFKLNGYKSVFSCRQDSHGGLVMYIRDDLGIKLISNEVDEGCHCIHAKVTANNKRFNVIAVYRPPNYHFSEFQNKLDRKLASIANDKFVFLVGDINIPVNLPSNNVVNEYRRLLESHDMHVTNTVVTRVLSNNILDHVVCNTEMASAIVNETIRTDVSDHSMILTSLKISSAKGTQLLTKRIINHNQMNERLSIALSTIPGDLNANDKLRMVISKFNEVQAASTKVVTVQAKVKGHCPWMTLDVWKMMKIKENLLKSSRRSPSDENLKELLKHASKRLQQMKDRSKSDYYRRLLSHSSNQKSWQLMNELLGRKVKQRSAVSLKIRDKEISDGVQVSKTFNDFFCSIGENLANGIDSDKDIWKFNTMPRQLSSVFLRPATIEEVILLIKNLKTNKSAGPDNIPATTIKNHHLAFANILTNVFNEIIETGEFPECLKKARVVPIFKSGDPTCVNNYRPISVLPVMSKILEQMIASRISEFLFSNSLIYERQYGFRVGCSTLTATCELMDEIAETIDNRKHSGALFLDLKKAFDTISHELLLQKLERYGIRGNAWVLLKSYLTNRQQFVSVNDGKSDLKNISFGVPQGSNLGPLLFLVFINDLSRLKLHGRIQLFADDTVVVYSSSDARLIVQYIQQDLQLLQEFFRSNLLSLNLQKTTYMVFHSSRRPVPELPIIQVDDVEICKVDHFKYLGLTVDSILSWENHIENLKNKLSVLCGVFRKISPFVPLNWMMNLYHSLVHSRLQYLVCLWGTASMSRVRELQVLQNRCLKIILKKPHLYPTEQLYNDMQNSLLPIRGLQVLQTLTHMHNIVTNPDTHHNMLITMNLSERSTRYFGNIRLARPNTELGKKRFGYQGSKLYNELPTSIKQQQSSVLYKANLIRHLKLHILRYLR